MASYAASETFAGISGTACSDRKCEYRLAGLNVWCCGKVVLESDPGNGEFRGYSGPS